MASIEKRNDKYIITVSCGYGFDENGERTRKIRKKMTYTPDPNLTPAKKKKAVEAMAAKFEADVMNGLNLDAHKITLKEFIDRWLVEYAEQKLQPGTVEKYKAEINAKIIPAIGHVKMSDLKPHTVNAFLVSLSKDGCRKDGRPGGYSRGSIAKTSAVLSSILRTAVEWEILERNPCDNVRSQGEPTADKIKFFTLEQTIAFLDYIEKPYTVVTKGHDRVDDTGKTYHVGDYEKQQEIPEQIRVLLNLAVYTGLRKGELLALEWSNIDFDNDCLQVTQSASVVGGEQITKDPKTRTSRRRVDIPHSLTLRLKALKLDRTRYRLSLGDYWQGGDWVFIQTNGKMMSYSTPYSAFHDALVRYNQEHTDQLPLIPFHGLRHTSATLLIADGQTARSVSARLGHAQTSTTMNIYAHALEESDRKAATAMERLLAKQA